MQLHCHANIHPLAGARSDYKPQHFVSSNDEKVVSFFSPLLKIDASMLKVVANRRDFSYIPFTPKVVEEQQDLADKFFKLKLIPKKINVSDVVDKQFLR
jgi:sulfonate transport system substrate-binding protein